MGKLREIMGKLRVHYALRFTHKILWVELGKNLIKAWKNQVFLHYGKLWVKMCRFCISLEFSEFGAT